MILSLVSTLALGVCAGLEVWYGAFYYGSNGSILSVSSTVLVQSYLAAAVGFALAAFLGVGDVCAVLKGH